MSSIECVDLGNEIIKHNPMIELDEVYQIVKSCPGSRCKYIRFVVIKSNIMKDVYWIFDNIETLTHNFNLATNKLKIINNK